MSESITVTGMVLQAAPVGDYDKRMVVLTKERGKITIFARGARKSTSPYLAIANPFVFGSFQVYEGKSAYTLLQAHIKEYFTNLAAKQPGVYYGFYFLEIADYFGREGSGDVAMLNLLYITMKALMKNQISNGLIRAIFELKSMVINGVYPDVFQCAVCGTSENLQFISARYESGICLHCAHTVNDARRITPTAMYAIQYIIAMPLEKLYQFTLVEDAEKEVTQWVEKYFQRNTDKNFKSLDILQVMEL